MEILKAIGPSFSQEVEASSVYGAPFSWSGAGVYWVDGALTPDQVTALTVLVSDHNSASQSKQQTYDAAVAAGFDTTFGWNMALDIDSQNQFAGSLSAANAQIALFQVTGNTGALATFLAKTYDVPDINGTVHPMATSSAIQLLLNYYAYAKAITLANS